MRVIDSHTEGEPTRVILDGAPDLGTGTLAARAARLATRHPGFVRASLTEPRGHDAIVGAILLPPDDPACIAGAIFFNPAGALGMCGHASMGLAVTLQHLGRIGPGRHRLETPVGRVAMELEPGNRVTIANVESYRHAQDVRVSLPDLGEIGGDVAWGGNWFFLADRPPVPLVRANIPELTRIAGSIRRALRSAGVSGKDGAEIDHVEFSEPTATGGADCRNFVLCPGGAHDRSPCGTGSSAKLACLAADGDWAPDRDWIVESIIGSRYRLSYRPGPGNTILPRITGRAFVVAESTLIRDDNDPYADGLPD